MGRLSRQLTVQRGRPGPAPRARVWSACRLTGRNGSPWARVARS
jgi:hypothetical protein